MIKHSESAFFYPDKIKFRRIENSESYITNKLVLERMKETARKKLKLSLKSKKVKHNKEHCHWYSLDKLVNKKKLLQREQRERETEWREERALTYQILYVYIKFIFITVTEKWSEQGLLHPDFLKCHLHFSLPRKALSHFFLN